MNICKDCMFLRGGHDAAGDCKYWVEAPQEPSFWHTVPGVAIGSFLLIVGIILTVLIVYFG